MMFLMQSKEPKQKKFEKQFFKILNIAYFGKTIEKIRKRNRFDLISKTDKKDDEKTLKCNLK